MADTGDRRAMKGKNNALRRQYRMLKAKGICVTCKRKPVHDRASCFECSDKQVTYNERTCVRSFIKRLDIDLAELAAVLAPPRSTPGRPSQTERLGRALRELVRG